MDETQGRATFRRARTFAVRNRQKKGDLTQQVAI